MATLVPLSNQQQLDANSSPLSGAKLYTYVAGSTTPVTTYQDNDLTTAHTNPIVLDSTGRIPPIYVPTGVYKFVFTDASDVQIGATIDNFDTSTDFDTIASISTDITALAAVASDITALAPAADGLDDIAADLALGPGASNIMTASDAAAQAVAAFEMGAAQGDDITLNGVTVRRIIADYFGRAIFGIVPSDGSVYAERFNTAGARGISTFGEESRNAGDKEDGRELESVVGDFQGRRIISVDRQTGEVILHATNSMQAHGPTVTFDGRTLARLVTDAHGRVAVGVDQNTGELVDYVRQITMQAHGPQATLSSRPVARLVTDFFGRPRLGYYADEQGGIFDAARQNETGLYVETGTDFLEVYAKGSQPENNEYVRFRIERSTDAGTRKDVWHITNINRATRLNGVWTQAGGISAAGAHEIAVQVSGQADFCGGDAHGNQELSSVLLLVDGVEYALDGTERSLEADRVELTMQSDLYEYLDAGPYTSAKMADAVTTWTFTHERMRMRNELTFSKSYSSNLEWTYLCMWSLDSSLTHYTNGPAHTKTAVPSATSTVLSGQDVNLLGGNLPGRFELLTDIASAGRFRIADLSGKYKLYNSVIGQGSAAPGSATSGDVVYAEADFYILNPN